MSSKSTNSSSQSVICGCGDRVFEQTSWSTIKGNYGRKYLRCPNVKEKMQCKFFDWIEPPTTCVSEIEEFNRKLSQQEAEILNLENTLKGVVGENLKLEAENQRVGKLRENQAVEMEKLKWKYDILKKFTWMLVVVVVALWMKI